LSKPSAIQFRQVTKYFRKENVLSHGLKNLLLHLPHHLKEARASKYLCVLDGVSLHIAEGESVAIIGRNGCGKSTTLGLMAGVLRPNGGAVEVNGHVCPLLELGAGFRPQLSGAENIFLNGVLLGMTRRRIREKFAWIAEFSELGEFLERPLRTYSAGMLARLGFSVAVHMDPQVLLVDEVLAVGDIAFAQKCWEKMMAFRKQGVTIVFVSHSLEAVKTLCDRAIWLEGAHVQADGAADTVCSQYQKSMMA
jgi:lipopolysaccharide transport system ATP-binding protein